MSDRASDRHGLAARLRGSGLEIGASNRPVPLQNGARVRYVDKFPSEIIRWLNPDIPENEALVEPDFLAPAEDLRGVADQSVDFVIASHVLEHIPDPIEALTEWHRVIRRGGNLYLCLPDMRGTFDATRARTSLSHLVLDHREGPDHPERRARDLEHYVEWARVVNKLTDPRQAAFWGDALRRARYPIHYHCWQQEDLVELRHVARPRGRATVPRHRGRSGRRPDRVRAAPRTLVISVGCENSAERSRSKIPVRS